MFFRIQPTYAQDTWISKKFWTFDFYDFLYNFFGLTNGYNGEWWFLISYVYAMISFPLISWFVKKNSAPVNVAAAVVGSLIMMETIPALGMNAKWGNLNEHFLFTKFLCQANTYSPSSTGCFWMGVVFAKEDLLRKGKEVLERNRLLNPLADLLILVVIILLRNTYADRSIDLL